VFEWWLFWLSWHLCINTEEKPTLIEHSIAILKTAICQILRVDPSLALAQVPWSDETRAKSAVGVGGEDYMLLWNTIARLAGPDANFLALGRIMGSGALNPILLACASAPNLYVGLSRVARYKTLFGPVKLHLKRLSQGLSLEITSEYDHLPLPASLGFAIGISMIEKSRIQTGLHVIPSSVTVPEVDVSEDVLQAYLGTKTTVNKHFKVTFCEKDVVAPFISENEPLWKAIEVDLERQLQDRNKFQSFTEQVEVAIRSLLINGLPRAELICQQMDISRSTFQRNLKSEGSSYQEILDKIRLDLSIRYLTKSRLPPSKIAFLVGFSDPKSFHRAFKSWLKKTPEEFRTAQAS
jgi:AraC-like DNA-binding protein